MYIVFALGFVGLAAILFAFGGISGNLVRDVRNNIRNKDTYSLLTNIISAAGVNGGNLIILAIILAIFPDAVFPPILKIVLVFISLAGWCTGFLWKKH